MALKKYAKRRHPLAYSYNSMMQRCYNPNNPQYFDYGGRGIEVCDRWKENQINAQGFWNFVADMGEKPDSTYSLERIDNMGNYEPSNCKWASRADQQRNRRNNILITSNGKTQCAKDWAKEVGVSDATISRRYKKGLPLDIVLSSTSFKGKGF